MATLTTSNNKFDQAFTLTKQTGTILALSTTGTYNAKDIQLTMNVRSATATLSAPASASITGLTYTYNSTSGCFGVAGSATITGTASFAISQSGWVESTVKQAISGSASLNNVTIPKVGVQATFSGTTDARKPIIQKQNTPSGVTNAASGNAITTAPTSGVYVAVRSNANTATVTAVVAVSSTGYGTTTQYTATNASATIGAAQSDMTYVPITAGVLTLDANGGASISSLSYSYNATSGKFNVSGSGALTGTATVGVTTAGWISSGPSAAISGTASLNGVTVDKIAIAPNMSGTAKVTPVISRTSTSASGATNVGSANATTTAPSDGYFVSVQSTSAANTIIAKASVTSAGYGTTSYFTATTATLDVGANASNVTYIPITTGIAASDSAGADANIYITDGGNAGVNIHGIVGTKATTEPSSGYYLAFTASGSGNSQVTTAGWFPTGSLASTTATAIKYFPIQEAEMTITGGTLTGSTGYSSLANSGYFNGTSYDTADIVDITTQTSEASGYYKLVTSGYGDVTRAAVTKQVYTAGYSPIDNAPMEQIASVTGTSEIGYNTYWIKKSTLSATSVASSNSNKTVTVYAGYYPTNRTITVTKMTTRTPTTSYANVGLSTYFTAGTSASYDVSITPRYSNSAGYVAAHTNTNNGGIGYWKIIPTSITENLASISDTTLTQGTASWETGWITADSISGASFANSPTADVSYLDISDTTGAPILVSGDYLYINKGYTDNLKISLAKLVPDGASADLTDTHILSGYSAYNNDGVLVAGNIATKTSADLGVNGATVYTPPGFYATTASKAIGNGQYSAGITLSSVTVTPSVSINNASTYGFTTTKPSGTNGTNYLTIDPGADTPTYSATGSASITTAGYLTTGNKYSSTTKAVAIAAGTNYYVPVIVPTFTGGDLNVTASTNSVSTAPKITISASGSFLSTGTATYGVTSVQPTGTDGTNYLKIDGNGVVSTTGIVASTYTVSRGVTYYNNSAGVIAAHDSTTTAIAGTTISGTATVAVAPTITDNFSPLYMPIVTSVGFNGGGLTVNTNTNSISTTAVVTINASGTFLSTGTANYGVTSTQPSGADGVDYLKIDGTGTVSTTGVVTSSVKMTRAAVTYTHVAGAIATHTNAQAIDSINATTGVAVSVTPKITDNFSPLYMPIVAPTFNGGELTGSTTNVINTNMTTSTSAVYYIDATATGTATRAIVTYNNNPGAIASHSNTNAISAVGLNMGSTASRVFVPTATGTVTMTPGNGSCILQDSTNIITSDTNTSGVAITFRGSGAVSATAKITNEGYTPTNNNFAAGISTSSQNADLTKYITGVTLQAPSSGTRTFNLTVPNGNTTDYITFEFTVDSSGNVTVQGPD